MTSSAGTGTPPPGVSPAATDIWKATYDKQNGETDARIAAAIDGPHGHVAGEFHHGRFQLDLRGADFVSAGGASVVTIITAIAPLAAPSTGIDVSIPGSPENIRLIAGLHFASSTQKDLSIQINNDTGFSYTWTSIHAYPAIAAVAHDGGVGVDRIRVGWIGGETTASPNLPEASLEVVCNSASRTGFYKTLDAINTTWDHNVGVSIRKHFSGGIWLNSTDPITSIQLLCGNGFDFDTGSWVKVYGFA